MENKLIRFYETELITFIDLQGKPFVAVKHICDAIGLNANSALRAIRNHPILGPASTVQYHQVGENQRREYLMVPIEYLNGWLFSIDINKVKPGAQEKTNGISKGMLPGVVQCLVRGKQKYCR